MKILWGFAAAILLLALAYLRLPGAAAPGDASDASPAAPSTIPSLYYPRIIEAHWGRNCHGKPVRNIIGIADRSKTYQVEANNLRDILNERCNQRPLCQLSITPASMGFDPAPHCKKELELTYRCFNFDTVHPVVLPVDQTELTIDCREDESKQ